MVSAGDFFRTPGAEPATREDVYEAQNRAVEAAARTVHWAEVLTTAETPQQIFYEAPDLFTEAVKGRGGLPQDIPLGTTLGDLAVRNYLSNASETERAKYAYVVASILNPGTQRSEFMGDMSEAEEPPPEAKGGGGLFSKLKGALGGVKDKAGDFVEGPIGSFFDALSWSSDRSEQALGFVGLFAESPSAVMKDAATAWEAAQLTYESAFRRENGKSKLVSAFERLRAGEGIEDIKGDYATGRAVFVDAAFKMALDPLVFVGGLKLAAKGKTLVNIPDLLGPALRSPSKLDILPGPLRTAFSVIGKTPQQSIYEQQANLYRAETLGRYYSTQATGEVGRATGLRAFANMTPASQAADATDKLAVGVHGLLLQNPELAADELAALGDVLKVGAIDALPNRMGRYWSTGEARMLGDVLREADLDFRQLQSLRKQVIDPKAWDTLSPDGKRAFYRSTNERNIAVLDEIMTTWTNKIAKVKGVDPDVPEFALAAERAVNSVKPWLSLFTLNRPGFVALNALNHMFTLGFHYGPLALRPTKWALKDAEKLTGISADTIRSFVKADMPGIKQGAGAFTGLRRFVSPFVSAATWIDQQAAMQTMALSVQRAWKFNMRFADEGGILPNLSDDVVNAIGEDNAAALMARIKGVNMSADSYKALKDEVMQGYVRAPITAVLLRKAKREGWDANRLQQEWSKYDDAVLDEINEIVMGKPTPAERITRMDLSSEGSVVSPSRQVFHGTGTRIERFDDSYADAGALFGPGVYLTDDIDIAAGYARSSAKKVGSSREYVFPGESPRRAEANIVRTSISPDIKLVNLEKALPQDVVTHLTRERDRLAASQLTSYVDLSEAYDAAVQAATRGKPGKDVYGAFRQGLGNLSSTDAMEYLESLNSGIQRLGYGGLAHVGGIQGGKKHLVNVVFDVANVTGSTPTGPLRTIDEDVIVAKLRAYQDDLAREVHTIRDYDHLNPFARESLTGRIGVDIDALSRQMQNAQSESLQRLMRAHGFKQSEVDQVFSALDEGFSKAGEMRNGLWNSIYKADKSISGEFYDEWEAYYPLRNQINDTMRQKIRDVISAKRPKLAKQVDDMFNTYKLTQQRVDDHLRATLKEAGRQDVGQQPLLGADALYKNDRLSSLWEAHQRFSEAQYARWRNDWFKKLGFEVEEGKYALAGEYPMLGEVVTVANHPWIKLIDDAIDNVDLLTNKTPLTLSPEVQAGLSKYVDDLEGLMQDANAATIRSAQAMFDFTVINYQRRYGFDGMLMMAYPYHFWPTRSMQRWMRTTMGRPGYVAAVAKLINAREDLNEGLPDRLKNLWKVPIPGLNEIMPEWATDALFVDPLAVMFPLAQMSAGEQFDDSPDDGNPWKVFVGHATDFMSKIGPGFGPWVSGPLALTGINGNWDSWVSGQLSTLPFGLPGQRSEKAIRALFHEGVDPSGLIDDQTKQDFILAKTISGDKLRDLLGMQEGDMWDRWRVFRMASALLIQDAVGKSPAEKDAMYTDLLRQLDAGTGPLLDRAMEAAQTEYGVRALTGWGLGMPVSLYSKGEDYMRRAYPEGNDIERGLDEIYRAAQKEAMLGNQEALDTFFTLYPEYKIKDIGTMIQRDSAEGITETWKKIDQTLWFIDREIVAAKWDTQIDELASQRTALEQSGAMQTREGRIQRELLDNDWDALKQFRKDDMDALDERYPGMKLMPPSYNDTAGERALSTLVNVYYDTVDTEGSDSPEAFTTAKQKFLSALQQGDSTNELLLKKVELDVKAERVRAEYNRKFAEAPPGQYYKLNEERNKKLDDIANEYTKLITVSEFEAWEGRNRKPPTAEYQEYLVASATFSEYLALIDSFGEGRWSRSEEAMANTFKESHPLISKYYGEDPLPKDNTEQRIAKAKMDEFWGEYYAVDEGRQRRDFLTVHLDEINSARAVFSLEPIRVANYRPPENELSVSLDGGPMDDLQQTIYKNLRGEE